MENKYLEALKTFKEEMIEYIEDNYEGEKGMDAERIGRIIYNKADVWYTMEM